MVWDLIQPKTKFHTTLLPDTWVQVAKGSSLVGNGPIRMGVTDIKKERKRLMDK